MSEKPRSALDAVHAAGIPGYSPRSATATRCGATPGRVPEHRRPQHVLREAVRRRDRQPGVTGTDAAAVPVIAQDGQKIDYGLGPHRFHLPGLGVRWGNAGTVWGAGTSMVHGTRRVTVAVNLIRWTRPSPIDDALTAFHRQAMSGDD